MPKEITDYLREGLPSKIYYYAFSEPISRYKIAQLLYGQPMTAHISEISRKMITEGYLIEKTEGIFSNVEPLANEIEKDLKNHNVTLTLSEKKELTNYLDKDLRKIHLANYLKDDVKIKGDINAYDMFTHMLIMQVYMITSFFPKGTIPKANKNAFLNKIKSSKQNPVSNLIEQIVNIQLSSGLIHKLNTLAPQVFEVFKKDIWKKV